MKPVIFFVAALGIFLWEVPCLSAQEEENGSGKKVEIQPDKNQKLSLAGGEEFGKSAGGALVIELEDGSLGVEMTFDLSDGVYFSAGYPLDLKRKFKTLRFSAVSEVECGFAVRVIDESGECFQFKFKNEKPGKKQEFEADLTRDNIECWGGDGNKKLDQPIKAIHFVVGKRDSSTTPSGKAVFSSMELKR